MYGAWNHGTTATVALLKRDGAGQREMFLAHVGDSRAVLIPKVRGVKWVENLRVFEWFLVGFSGVQWLFSGFEMFFGGFEMIFKVFISRFWNGTGVKQAGVSK